MIINIMEKQENEKTITINWDTKRMTEECRKKYWSETRSPFTKPYEVPSLPIVDKKEWEEFYVPILIERGAIPKNKLVVGKRYYGCCRIASVAVWLGDVFEYQR